MLLPINVEKQLGSVGALVMFKELVGVAGPMLIVRIRLK